MMINTNQEFVLSPNVEFLPFDTSGNTVYLARLPNAQQFQISQKMYDLLMCLKTPQSLETLGETFFATTSTRLSQESLLAILAKVRAFPQLLEEVHNNENATHTPVETPERIESALQIHFRRDILSPEALSPVTQVFSVLFQPRLARVLVFLGLLVQVLILFHYRQLTTTILDTKTLFLAYLITLSTTFFHEIGHSSAVKYYGGTMGWLGAGIYFLYPVLYVDLSQIWKLPRFQRLVIDLGGLYFDLFSSSLICFLFILTKSPVFLWVILLIQTSIVFNLNPIVKFDGYWAASDALGIPNLHKRANQIRYYGMAWIAWKLRLRTNQPLRPAFTPINSWVSGVLILYTLAFTVLIAVAITVLLLNLPLILFGFASGLSNGVQSLVLAVKMRDIAAAVNALLSMALPCLMTASLAVVAKRAFVSPAINAAKKEPIMFRGGLIGGVVGGALGTLITLALVIFMINLFQPSLLRGGGISGNSSTAELAVGTKAPDFTATDLAGNTFRLNDHRGKSVVLQFWSPNCSHCVDELPVLKEAYQTIATSSTTFMTVTYDSEVVTKAFVKDQNVTFPVIASTSLTDLYGIRSVPSIVIIDSNGIIKYNQSRQFNSAQELLSLITQHCGDGVCSIN
jgi:putative peptide zinc metalloprotease protein